MIEFGNCANRFPAELRVAILAGNVQGSVRAARDRSFPVLPPSEPKR
jgi:hypothetical protein